MPDKESKLWKDWGKMIRNGTARDGPWVSEPDFVAWTTSDGFEGRIYRNRFGSLNGYVGIPTSHPLANRDGHDDLNVDLTYSGPSGPTGPGNFEDTGTLWWFGFDCGHSSDILPLVGDLGLGGVYRTVPYVRDQVERLSAQLARQDDVPLPEHEFEPASVVPPDPPPSEDDPGEVSRETFG